MTVVLSSAASVQLEILIKRGYSVVLGVMTIQLWVRQVSQREQLNSLSDIVLVLLLLSVLGVIISAWLGRANNLMLGIHGAVGLLAVLLTPAMSLDTLLTVLAFPGSGFHWVWSTVTLSAISVAAIFELRPPFWIYLSILLIASQIVQTSSSLGTTNLLGSLQGLSYVFFLVVAIAGMYSVVRYWSRGVDIANSVYLTSSIDRYKVDAVEKEDLRIDALIHDSVLHALLFAAAAKTPEERKASVTLARQASDKVRNFESSVRALGDTSSSSLFRSLSRAAQKISPGIKVSTYVVSSEFISNQAAQAITEASLQAIDNAIKHSNFTKLELKLNCPGAGLVTVHIIDNGRGFRPERVSKLRIGIRGSIVGRMDLVGGSARIKSIEGIGSTVSLRWPK